MKLALITETFPPEINGVAMTLHRVAKGLSSRGHQVEVICPQRDQRVQLAEEGRFTLRMVPGMPLPRYEGLRIGFPARRKLEKAWRAAPPDLVHVATEGPLGWSAIRAARKAGIPFITTYHTNFHCYGAHYGYRFLNKGVLWWLRTLRKHAAATFVPSEKLRDELAQAGFSRLSILGRGVDTSLYDPGKRSAALRATWGAGEHTPVALYVGRIAGEKNIPLTLEAYEAMRKRLPDLKLVVVGDGPERRALQEAHPHVHFAGMQQGEDLARHYASGDLFLFASVTETFGNVITEAMASGLVVLSYDYAAAHTYIRDGVNGRLAPLGQSAAYLAAAEELAANRDSWKQLRSAARETVLPVSWESILDGFEAELEAIAFPPAGSSARTDAVPVS